MSPRQRCLACLDMEPPRLFEAWLWLAVEHEPLLRPEPLLHALEQLRLRLFAALPTLPVREQAQPLLRQLAALGFMEDSTSLSPLLPQDLLQHRRGTPLGLAILALELARRLEIPLEGVDFPGQFLLRVPGADHLLQPGSGRRLYPGDCRQLLQGELRAEYFRPCSARQMIRLLSRQLRERHRQAGDPAAALLDAERVIELGHPDSLDHLARAGLYQVLDCPRAERYDLERALLLCNEPGLRLQLDKRLRNLRPHATLLH